MARAAKKETSLTAEEKLAQALVPEAEQPYKVPENWCWTRVGAICSFSGGGTPSKNNPVFWNGNIPWASVKDVKGDYLYETIDHITEAGFENSATNMCDENDLILITRIEPAKTIISAIRTAINQDLKIVKSDLSASFLHYYFKTFQHVFELKSSGSTVKGITVPNVANTPFPLPPLIEQQRIVDRIDSLFAKLDEAKEKAQAVVDGFEDRKAAILHKAFTGELTKQWREARHINDCTWEKKRIDQISVPRAGFAFDSKKFSNHGYQIIRMGNLYGGILDLSRNPVFILPKDVDEKALNRSLINDGDILITLTGTKYKRDYGYAVCIHNPDNLLVNQRIMCLSPNQTVIPNYLLYYLHSNLFRDVFFSNETGGVNQGNVSSKFVESIEIPFPTISEQRIIVEGLDKIMEKESSALELAEQVIDQIDTMKKAILARAFRGELGTNDPTDESAEELLKRVL